MYKIIDTFCRERDNGKPEYTVTVSSRYGVFTEKASPCDEDIELCSDCLGYKLAEYKCFVQILRAKSAVLRERMNGIHNVCEALSEKYCALDMNGNRLINDAIFLDDLIHQYNVSKRDYENVHSEYKRLRDGYKDFVNARLQDRRDADEYISQKRNEIIEE